MEVSIRQDRVVVSVPIDRISAVGTHALLTDHLGLNPRSIAHSAEIQ